MSGLSYASVRQNYNLAAQRRVTADGAVVYSTPATRQMHGQVATLQHKLRVAAYARVSTEKDEQQSSYEAQIDYYTTFIKAHDEWEYAGLYADEGLSATSTAKREGFNRMIEDALAGKIDRILTKSVSRFARNTVDSLTTIRKLKDKGIGVTFEKESIDTLDAKGELLITLMSSLAQEESRSISENTTWGQRKRFADGKVTMPFGRFLGYDRGTDGKPVINENEAVTVRQIYSAFLDGRSPSAIARALTAKHIPTPGGCEKWQTTTVVSILTNEKYRGDALLQKKVTVDFLTKKMKPNEGEAPQHYVTGSHPAIVTAEVFELTQNEMKRRQESGRRICSDSIFASKILCGDCGGIYGSKVWNSNSKYRRVIWQCNHKYGRKGKSEANMCSTPHLTEDQIKKGFMAMVNEMLTSKNEIIAFYKDMLGRLTDTERIKTEIGENERQLDSLNDQLRAWIDENARRAMDQAMYNQRYDELAGQATDLTQRLGTLQDKLREMRVKREKANAVLNMIERQGLESVVAFDESLFGAIVDTITVHVGKLVFQLKDGTKRETKL